MSLRPFLLFVISLNVLLLTIPAECYAKTSTILGTKSGYGTTEEKIGKQLAGYIYNCSLLSNYWSYDWYGPQTTASNIYRAAFGLGDGVAISFYVGHAGRLSWWHYLPYPHEHIQYAITADDSSTVFDSDIYQNTTCRNLKFVYLLACEQGDEIGSLVTYACGQERARGMPIAWLHTNSLSSDGYANPDGTGYAFSGFQGAVPALSEDEPLPLPDYVSYYFTAHFYELAMRNGYSIKDALDHAARWTFNNPINLSYKFSDSAFYKGYTLIDGSSGKMVVYGDGNLQIGSASSTPPVPYPPDPSGGGCPYVSTWDGGKYVLDNNILPTSGRNNGTDVGDYYKLEQALAPRDGKYSLLISEFEREHSYIDQVKLLAVDHDSDVNIAVTPSNEILTYKNPNPPISAIDNYGNNRLKEIRYIDGDVSNPATYFYGAANDYLILNFGKVNSHNAKLILRDDMKSEEVCIDVQILNSNGQWQTVATVTPRSYWAIEGADLSPYVVKNQDFMVRLFWTSPHRLDYVGLDTTKQEDYEITYANLVSATHSTQGDVKALLSVSDNLYVELIPGQQIQLDFTLTNNTKETRTYILYTKGHYYTIP